MCSNQTIIQILNCKNMNATLVSTATELTTYGLSLPKEKYQEYLAFIFMILQSYLETSDKNNYLFAAKIIFDKILATFSSDELISMIDKEDFFLYYISYMVLKIKHNISQSEFQQSIQDLKLQAETSNLDELYIAKIALLETQIAFDQPSPFQYLNEVKHSLSASLLRKIVPIIVYMIGDAKIYLMPSKTILGSCLQWAIKHFSLTDTTLYNITENLLKETTVSEEARHAIMTEIIESVYKHTDE